jgi:ribosomal protein S18 acetylase RimI-like enzyme
VDIVAFTDEHVDGAARILAERHTAHLEVEPLLPHVTDFRAQVETERADGSGAVAVAGGEVVGFLLGKHRADPFGPHIWSHVAAHAVREPELARDLYAVAAARWVDEGLTRHFVFVPAMRELVEPWLRLTFGISAALAARETAPEPGPDLGITIRQSTPHDLRDCARLDRMLPLHLRESPSFSEIEVGSEEWFVDDWRGTWEDETMTHFVADQGGEIVGHMLLYRRPEGDLRVPPNSIDLADALTEPGIRGSGVGVALTAHALNWAHEHGFRTMITDWRMTNLEASRFWPRRGFRETFLRLYRSIP